MKRPAAANYTLDVSAVPIPGLAPYHLLKLKAAYSQDGFHGIEYDISRKSQDQSPRADRPMWGETKLSAEWDTDMRCDLSVRFYNGGFQVYHSYYHRVVGLTLLPCYWDNEGNLLAKPYYVKHRQWTKYDCHHRDTSTWNVHLSNLCVLTKVLHTKVNRGLVLPMPSVWPYV